MRGGENMDVKDILKSFSDFELTVMQERLHCYLFCKESKSLEDLLYLIVEEINNRKH